MGDSGHFLFPSPAVPKPRPAQRGTRAAPLTWGKKGRPTETRRDSTEAMPRLKRDPCLSVCHPMYVSLLDFVSLSPHLCVSLYVFLCLTRPLILSVCLYVSVFLPVALPLAHFSWLTANEGGAVPIRRHWSPQTSLVFLPLAHAPWPRLIMRVFPMGFLPERVQDVLISSFVFTVWRPRH